MTTLERLSKVKLWYMIEEPFIGQLLMLKIIEDPKCPTIGVSNKGTMEYNDEFVKSLNDKQLLWVMAHEVLHLAYLHPFRCGNRNPRIWNIAADLKVNCDLMERPKEIGERLKNGLLPNKSWNSYDYEIMPDKKIYNIESKTTEQIYDEIIEICKNNLNKIKIEVMEDLIMNKEIAGAEASAIENEIRAKVFEAMCNVKDKGNIPRGLAEEYKAMAAPKIKWNFVISQRLKSMLKEKSWKMPNKKYLPYYFPGSKRKKTSKILFAIDTSGSMSDDEINEALSEILGYANTFRTHEFYIIPCDCDEYEPIRIKNNERNKLKESVKLMGRGGTDYKPVFEMIKKRWYNDIDSLVFFTDLECDFPKDPPPYPIFWVSRNSDKEVPYGRVIHL